MKNDLSVIVPSKTASNLIPCVQAIRAAGEVADIIVVSDFDDHALARLALEECPGVGCLCKIANLVAGQKPFVFARNVNIGIRAAGSDDVIVLNDDALLQSPGGFTLMQQAAEDYPEFGIIGATCNNVGNPNQSRIKGGGIYGAGIRGGLLAGLRQDKRMVCFTAVLVPRRTLENVGLLDERFISYGCEDDDYCLRVRKAGLKIGIHDGCYVDHGSLASSFRAKGGAGGDYRPNLRRFIEKWGVDNWGCDRTHSHFKELFP